MKSKHECPHPLKHLQAPCGCCIDCPSKTMMLISEPTEEHKALHREHDAGIIHQWDCGLIMVPVEQLVINKELLKEKGIDYDG